MSSSLPWSATEKSFIRQLFALLLVPTLATPAIAADPDIRPSRPADKRQAPATTERITVHAAVRAPDHPAGETTMTANQDVWAGTPARTAADMLATVPGISTLNGNGPRDIAISIRGSDDRQSYGLRNIQVLEDGFPLTQPDGLARADLIDPHAYAGVDVVEGPSSTVYGNYANDGALLFHTRDGADVDGVELGSDFGSFGSLNQYATIGEAGRGWDLSVFGSDVRGDGYLSNSTYEVSTENAKLRIDLSPRDRLVFKVINNVTDTHLPIRQSFDQYQLNPYQVGCSGLQSPGCPSISAYLNGAYGAKEAVSAQTAGLGRFDRRTLVGARWEHDIDAATLWRTQFAYDERDIDQPTSNTSYTGVWDSYNVTSDVTNNSTFLGLPLRSFAGVDWNYLDLGERVFNVTPAGGATIGALVQTVFGHQWNGGARFEEQLTLARRWHLVAGLGGEYSDLGAMEANIANSAVGSSSTFIVANRYYFNLAPEGALVFDPNQAWTLHARVGTGYGTPQTTNLFVTPQGVFGNNTQLRTQTNVGLDLGAAWHPLANVSAEATGFYEWFSDELVSQSAGVNLQSYTFNAPASVHRGVELSLRWRPLPTALSGGRAQLSYTYDDQVYTDYTEVLSGAGTTASFDRAGNSIPGVIPNVLDARLLYDQPAGRLEGVGGFLEFSYRSGFFLDNANLLRTPSAPLLNLELHYDPPARDGLLHRFGIWFEVENLTNRTYVGTAGNLTDTLGAGGVENAAAAVAATTGSIYAGAPRSFLGGVRVRL